MNSMFVLVSHYTAPMDQVQGLTGEHSDWIAGQYAAGRVLVSGRQEPPAGGVIVVRGESREDVEQWIASDPFVLGGAAAYDITQFGATDHPKRSEALDVFFAADAATR